MNNKLRKALEKELERRQEGLIKTAYEILNIVGNMIKPIRPESLKSKNIRDRLKGALNEGLKVIKILEEDE